MALFPPFLKPVTLLRRRAIVLGLRGGDQKPTALLRRRAVVMGLRGEDRRWLAVGATFLAYQKAKELLGKGTPRVVHTEQLDPGERFIILHSPAAPKKARRARRRA